MPGNNKNKNASKFPSPRGDELFRKALDELPIPLPFPSPRGDELFRKDD